MVEHTDSARRALGVWRASLRLPENTLRVIAPNVGGGFGVKNQLYPEEIVALAKLAQIHNMPLKWAGTRVEHFICLPHRDARR